MESYYIDLFLEDEKFLKIVIPCKIFKSNTIIENIFVRTHKVTYHVEYFWNECQLNCHGLCVIARDKNQMHPLSGKKLYVKSAGETLKLTHQSVILVDILNQIIHWPHLRKLTKLEVYK